MDRIFAFGLIATILGGCHCSSANPRQGKTVVEEPVTTTAAATNSAAAPSPCPENSVLVEGDYCPDVEQVCLKWVGNQGQPLPPPPSNQTGRCGEWKQPSVCKSATKVHKRFCIDKYEYPNHPGEIPQDWMSWYDVKNACEAQGKRLCAKQEWTFACEGPEMHPYPYGDGYHRDRTSCNTDNLVPEENGHQINVLKVTTVESAHGQILHKLLVPSGSKEKCVSPFGVFDMVGNLDEFVDNPNGHHWHPPTIDKDGKKVTDRGPFVSGLVGGHVFGVRNACRPMTDSHNEGFNWYETGGRCCSDPK